MALQNRNTLKQWFKTDAYPTQQQFWDFIDSVLLSGEVQIGDIANLLQVLQGKADQSALLTKADLVDGKVPVSQLPAMGNNVTKRIDLPSSGEIIWNFTQGNIGVLDLNVNSVLTIDNCNELSIGGLYVRCGANTLTLPGQLGDIVLSTDGKTDFLSFQMIGGVLYWEKINSYTAFPQSSGNTGGSSVPTVVGIVTDGAGIAVTFNESITGTSAGWSFKKNGVPMTITGVTQPTSTVLSFAYSDAVLNTDTITASYDSTTGNTLNTSNNELVSFTDAAVTNNTPGGGALYDADAQVYFDAVEAVGGTISASTKTKYSNWVVREKSAGVYARYTYLYPMLGDTAAAHAINAKSPGTNNLTWNGSGWTHTAAGVKSDKTGGTNATPGISPADLLRDDNHAIAYLSETIADGYVLGSYAAGAGSLAIGILGSAYPRNMCDAVRNYPMAAGGDPKGIQMVSRTSSSEYLYANASAVTTIADPSDGQSPNPIQIGDLGGLPGNGYSGRIAFVSFGKGFNAAEAAAVRTSLNQLMTDLNR